MRNGRVIEIGDSFHHVMLDNPGGADRRFNPGFGERTASNFAGRRISQLLEGSPRLHYLEWNRTRRER